MPRDGSNVYHLPVGTTAVVDTTIDSAKYNNFTADLEADANLPRPIVAGGTGATSSAAAIVALGGERTAQVISNYNSDVFVPGSFSSLATATSPPVAGHAFSGICYQTDAANQFIEARDQDDTTQPGRVWVRQRKAGTWSSWRVTDDPATYVDTAGDTMTGPLILSADPTAALGAATKQYADTMLPKAGGTMTGAITLAADPAAAMQPATKQYVDSAVSGATSNVMVKTGNQTITGGFNFTPNNLSTLSSFTPNPMLGNYQYGTNNAAFTLTAPTSDCAIDLLITNGATAGAITFSGFTVAAGNTGDALTTTNGSKFIISIRRINAIATYVIKALQ